MLLANVTTNLQMFDQHHINVMSGYPELCATNTCQIPHDTARRCARCTISFRDLPQTQQTKAQYPNTTNNSYLLLLLRKPASNVNKEIGTTDLKQHQTSKLITNGPQHHPTKLRHTDDHVDRRFVTLSRKLHHKINKARYYVWFFNNQQSPASTTKFQVFLLLLERFLSLRLGPVLLQPSSAAALDAQVSSCSRNTSQSIHKITQTL